MTRNESSPSGFLDPTTKAVIREVIGGNSIDVDQDEKDCSRVTKTADDVLAFSRTVNNIDSSLE
ncbi:hypothetical protein Ancab_023600 [Ancistrocladus abbreviatus]